MRTITIGVDLAKEVFSVCSVDDVGRVLERRELRRNAFSQWLPSVAAGTIVAMEACSGAHYWARRCQDYGLQPRLMAAQFVVPFRKSRTAKNDRNDAEAIATAARQGNMRFVPVKTVDQQVRLSWHRVREGYKAEHLATGNRLRGLLSEFGVVVAQSDGALRRKLADLDAQALPSSLVELLRDEEAQWQQLQARIAQTDREINAHAKADEACTRLRAIIGVGPITADAVVATIGSAQSFANGRQFAAWLGLVPMQYSSGGRTHLGRISCRGDGYLRTLLIQGARSSLQRSKAVPWEKATPEQRWIQSIEQRLPFGKVLVAIANKHARQLWAMLARGETYDADAWLKHPMVQRPASRRRAAG